MQWILGLMLRTAQFWGVWIPMLVLVHSAGLSSYSAFCGTLLMATLVLLLVEHRRTGRAVTALNDRLTRVAVKAPPRWRQNGWLWPLGFVGTAAMLWMWLTLSEGAARPFYRAMVGTLAIGMLVSLLLEGVTLTRFGFAARKERPPRPTVRPMPFVVAAWSALALLVALDLPRMLLAFGVQSASMAAAMATLAAPVAQMTLEGGGSPPALMLTDSTRSACGGPRVDLGVNDPHSDRQGALQEIHAESVLRRLMRRRPLQVTRVAVLDGDLDHDHPDLATEVVTGRSGHDVHATAIAGLIAAVADNGRDLASFNVGGRFIDLASHPIGRGLETEVAYAVEDAAEGGARVINLSFAMRGEAPWSVRRAVASAIEDDVLVVAAAGNEGRDARDYWPANLDGVLVVAASDGGRLAGTSNRVDGIRSAVSAPGSNVDVLTPGGGVGCASGTSMSAALVSGLAGAMRATCPSLQGHEIARILVETGDSEGSDVPRVRADRAFDALAALGCGG